MGKFQLNKKGEDPLKIYEDTFKIANDTVETHLGKLGKQPKPISESRASEVWIDIFYYIQSKPQGVTYEELKEKFGGRSDFEYFLFDHIMDGASRRMAYWDGKLIKAHESRASEDWEDEESERVQKALDKMNADAYMKQLTKKGYNEESLASETFTATDEEILDYIRNNPYQNATPIMHGLGWDGVEDIDVDIMSLYRSGKIETQNGGYVVNESKASEDHPVEDITDVHVHGKNNSVDKVSGVDITVEEADNFPQKDFGSANQWEDDLDELRGLGGKLPDNNALWNSVEAIASEGKDAYGNYDAHSMPPASGYTGRNWDSRSDIEQQADVDQKIKNVLDEESLASEDYGNMNTVQNPDLDTDGYPMDQEGFSRSSWDDASIEDRKNWLFVAGYDSERGDEYEPYFSLDSHIRAQLMKDLHIGGIYAMGTGSL
jgi:hypothetical protein